MPRQRYLQKSDFRWDDNTGLVQKDEAPDESHPQSHASRLWFARMMGAENHSRVSLMFIDNPDMFCIATPYGGSVKPDRAEVWYMYGWRVEIDYFNSNVLLLPTWPLDDDACSKWELYSRLFHEMESRHCRAETVGDMEFISVTRGAGFTFPSDSGEK